MKNASHSFPFLRTPITDLSVSDQFKLMANLNGFITMEDVVASDLDKLPGRKASGMSMLKEALDELEAHGLGHLAED